MLALQPAERAHVFSKTRQDILQLQNGPVLDFGVFLPVPYTLALPLNLRPDKSHLLPQVSHDLRAVRSG